MRMNVLLGAGLTLITVCSLLLSPSLLTAQKSEKAGGRPGAESRQAPRHDETTQRGEAQARAQLDLMTVQKRQLEEQAREQIQQFQEQTEEQIEQLRAETNRQIEQLKRQTARQIEQFQRQVRRQQDLLEAQRRIVEAQAGVGSGAAMRGAESRQLLVAPSPQSEERIRRLLDRLERLENELDKLEKKPAGERSKGGL